MWIWYIKKYYTPYIQVVVSTSNFRIAQAISSQTVSISGTTGGGSAHSHSKGTFRIYGKITGLNNITRAFLTESTNETGPFLMTYTDSKGVMGATTSSKDYAPKILEFDTDNGGWSGSSGSESAHTHTFSSSATIGSGSYIRPNSRTCLICIRY